MAKDLKKSMSAAIKAGDLYYMKGKVKMLAVTKEMLDKWKKDNKGNYDGKALTAYANAKGKNIKPLKTSLRPKLRGDSKDSKITKTKLKLGQKGDLFSDRHKGPGPSSGKTFKEKIAESDKSLKAAEDAVTSAKQAIAAARVKQGANIIRGKRATHAPPNLKGEAVPGDNMPDRLSPALLARQEALRKRQEALKNKKNKGGMIMKKKPAVTAAKMMGGGMMRTKKKSASMYNKGGAAKKR